MRTEIMYLKWFANIQPSMSEFLNLSTWDILGRWFFVVGGCLGHFGMFNSIPGFYALDVSSTHHPPPLLTAIFIFPPSFPPSLPPSLLFSFGKANYLVRNDPSGEELMFPAKSQKELHTSLQPNEWTGKRITPNYPWDDCSLVSHPEREAAS